MPSADVHHVGLAGVLGSDAHSDGCAPGGQVGVRGAKMAGDEGTQLEPRWVGLKRFGGGRGGGGCEEARASARALMEVAR